MTDGRYGTALNETEKLRVAELVRTAERLRGLEILRPIPVAAVSEDDLSHAGLGGSEDGLSVLYESLGLLPSAAAAPAAQRELAREQVVGAYGPGLGLLIRADMAASILEEPPIAAESLRTQPFARFPSIILVHEIVHALQDQHFEQQMATRFVSGQADRNTAWKSLIEGDATLAMILYLGERLGASLLDRIGVDPQLQIGRSPQLDSAPPIVRDVMTFEYFGGAGFVADVARRGGWSAVNALYARPPAATADLMHAERYARAVVPAPVALPAVAPTGHALVHEDTLGELRTRTLLEQHWGAGDGNAYAAAAGWQGDRARVWRSSGGHLATLWLSAWESITQASEHFLGMCGALIGVRDADALRTGCLPGGRAAVCRPEPRTRGNPRREHCVILIEPAYALVTRGFERGVAARTAQRIADTAVLAVESRPPPPPAPPAATPANPSPI